MTQDEILKRIAEIDMELAVIDVASAKARDIVQMIQEIEKEVAEAEESQDPGSAADQQAAYMQEGGDSDDGK